MRNDRRGVAVAPSVAPPAGAGYWEKTEPGTIFFPVADGRS